MKHWLTGVRLEIGKVYRLTSNQDTVFEGQFGGLVWKGAGIGWEMLFGDRWFHGNGFKAVEEVE